jgi:hypothetical protein
MVNISKALRFGILWGLVALILAVIEFFLRPIIQPLFSVLDQINLSLAWFAVMMAGVHYGARSGFRGWLSSLFGGAIAGLIAAIFIILVTFVLHQFMGGTALDISSSFITLAVAFFIGMFGGFAGEFIDRQH